MTTEADPESDGAQPKGTALSPFRVRAGWVLAVAGCAALTAVLAAVGDGSDPGSEAMLFLALAVACALLGGAWPAAAASAFGALSLNYFFTDPLHTLRISSTLDLLALVVYVVVSVTVASVVDSAARRRTQATAARREADTLEMLGRRVLGGDYDVPQLLDVAREHFGARGAELTAGDVPLGPDDTAVSIASDTLLVLRGARLSPRDQRVLAAFGRHVGVLQERAELLRQTEAARELEAGNRTRTALLAAISHDLRTPLTGIRTAAQTLIRHPDQLTDKDRADLLDTIARGTDRLTTIVTDLLDMSRLQTGAVTPVLDEVVLAEVLHRVLADLDAARVQLVGELPAVRADASLLERVLMNLVSNALRHTRGQVEVNAEPQKRGVIVRVVDHGPGVPPEERLSIFEPFRRLGDQSPHAGVGLGLAVARGLAEAQGQALWAEETPGGGLTMALEIAVAS